MLARLYTAVELCRFRADRTRLFIRHPLILSTGTAPNPEIWISAPACSRACGFWKTCTENTMSENGAPAEQPNAFDDLLRQCHAKVHDVHDIPIAGTHQHQDANANNHICAACANALLVPSCQILHTSTDPREANRSKATTAAHETTDASLLANDTRFVKLRPFTSEYVSCGSYFHGPRCGAAADPTHLMGQTVAMDKGGHISRSGWFHIVETPDFYNASKIARRSCTPTFARVRSTLQRFDLHAQIVPMCHMIQQGRDT